MGNHYHLALGVGAIFTNGKPHPSSATFPILSRDPSRKPPETQGSGRFSKRTMVGKNGESTLRLFNHLSFITKYGTQDGFGFTFVSPESHRQRCTGATLPLQRIPADNAQRKSCLTYGCVSKFERQGTAGFRLPSHSPGFHFGPLCYSNIYIDKAAPLVLVSGFRWMQNSLWQETRRGWVFEFSQTSNSTRFAKLRWMP